MQPESTAARRPSQRSNGLATAIPPETGRRRLVEAWADFLGRWSWEWFCTLTFRGNAVHPEAADKRFRVWVSKVNRELYGPRWWKHGQGVRWVRALEVQRRGVIHYHALLGGAGVDELRRLTWMDEWDRLAGYARIEPPANGAAVRSYCAKYVAKGGEVDLWSGPRRRPPRGLGVVPGRWFRAPRDLPPAEMPARASVLGSGPLWGAWEPKAPPWPGRPGIASVASVA